MQKRVDQSFSADVIRAFVVVVIVTQVMMPSIVLAQQQPPSNATWVPAANVGTCTQCGNWHWTNQAGVACQTFTCLGPNWPKCAEKIPSEKICTPGSTFNVTQCSVTGVETCSYTCNTGGTGYLAPVCRAVGNGGNFRRQYCDYNASCPVNNGFVEGRPTTIDALCTQNGAVQTITRGACGTGGCSRKLICRPGQPCCRPGIDPACTPQCQSHGETIDVVPKCGPGGQGYQCTYGKLTLSVPLPCPSVTHKPFPRALVGQPIQFEITNACADLPTSGNRVDVGPPYDVCGDTIVAYEGQLAWICSTPDMSDAEWMMDERAWNVGKVGADGPILAQRTGATIRHTYETSSVDLAPNGPGYPDMLRRQPAYQVQLKTNYSLVGAFRYHYRTQERRCYNDAGKTQQRECRDSGYCDNPGFPERQNEWQCRPEGASETVWITPTREAPVFILPNIPVIGAKTPQDLGNPNSCGVIATSVLQSQAVLGVGQ